MQTDVKRSRVERTERWLQLCFAALSCLGGLALASGPGTEMIPVLAVFFAVFGFVFVDWLKLFELPPVGAYIAMGAAAVYCVSDFWNLHTKGSQQMIAVALLLVLVQAILMLQRKTPRVFEQLAVFCLLQLVVGAVFNDALRYGLLLIPLALIGGWALSLMSAVAASEGIETRGTDAMTEPIPSACAESDSPPTGLRQRLSGHWLFRPIGGGQPKQSNVHAWSVESILSLANAARRVQRFNLLTLAPAVFLVGAIFFYALPRTTGAARMHSHGQSLVGFSDEVRLEQFGRMQRSSATALRIRLFDRDQGKPYMATQGMYLRGQVLEIYRPKIDRVNPTATWAARPRELIGGNQRLPFEYSPRLSSDRNFYDSVEVEVTCEAMQTRSLFALAPYHGTTSADLIHAVDKWTIARQEEGMASYPALEYAFGTNAFNQGIQSPWLTRATPKGRAMSSLFATTPDATIPDATTPDAAIQDLGAQSSHDAAQNSDRSLKARSRTYAAGSYEAMLTKFDARTMPGLEQLAHDIMGSIPPSERTVVQIARAFERHLSTTGGFQYTLDLNSNVPASMDPIEHFVTLSRRGHCQFFASALAMMLRSVNIPARLVVGYHTDEYNDLGQYFVARQLHAHAWVEVLVDADQRPENEAIYGQWPSDQHWLRLDPTPGDQNLRNGSGGAANDVFNLAEDMWGKIIVGMDAQRQSGSVVSVDESRVVNSFANWLQRKIAQIRAGNLGGGTLAGGDGTFSWKAALIGAIVAVALLTLLRLPIRRWFKRQITRKTTVDADKPTLPFYADALQELARMGFKRKHHQTPREFVAEVGDAIRGHAGNQPACSELANTIESLTNVFYETRYGSKPASDVGDAMQALRRQVAEVVSDKVLMNQIGNLS